MLEPIIDGTYLFLNKKLFNVSKYNNFGYWVANGRKGNTISPNELYKGTLNRNAQLLSMINDVRINSNVSKFPFIGIWTDPDTGIVYVDPVRWVEDRQEAMDIAHAYHELCIFDIEANRSIRVRGV